MAEASAPGSSGNVGPGFDTLALALDIRCHVEAETSETWDVRHAGLHRPDGVDVVLEAAKAAVGEDRPLRMVVDNEIPIGRGLGSSAAAAVAGAGAALLAVGVDPTHARLLEIASTIDGHPDNAAASVYGGFVSVTTGGAALRLELHPDLVPVVAVPHRKLPTKQARRVLDRVVERQLAVRSLQRIVALVEGLRRADAGMLTAAAGDEMHEAPRSHLNPVAGPLIAAALEAGALHACWSGAGPSVLALVRRRRRPLVADALGGILGKDGVVLLPDVALGGVELSS